MLKADRALVRCSSVAESLWAFREWGTAAAVKCGCHRHAGFGHPTVAELIALTRPESSRRLIDGGAQRPTSWPDVGIAAALLLTRSARASSLTVMEARFVSIDASGAQEHH
jgi:hypothetical protein